METERLGIHQLIHEHSRDETYAISSRVSRGVFAHIQRQVRKYRNQKP